MSRTLSVIPILALVLSAWFLPGCDTTAMPPPGDTKQAAKEADPPGLAKLNEADRKAAKAQKTCPVTDELLGSMGAPVKVTVKNRTVFLCCDGCKDELMANPDKYLKKLDSRK
jgi:hypothetical protein